jgi:hypothetical protein
MKGEMRSKKEQIKSTKHYVAKKEAKVNHVHA